MSIELDEDGDCTCSQCAEMKYGKAKPKWFTTDKPLPDGDYYWWRYDKSFKPEILHIVDGIAYGFEDIHEDFSGEWCEIEFPE